MDTGELTLEQLHNEIEPVKGEPILGHSGMLLYQSNGMAGEAGEVANAVKKMIRDMADFHDGDEAVVSECGDVLFYMSRLLRLRGKTLEDAAFSLLAKLEELRLERDRK